MAAYGNPGPEGALTPPHRVRRPETFRDAETGMPTNEVLKRVGLKSPAGVRSEQYERFRIIFDATAGSPLAEASIDEP